jgi:SAM-dependent methyltransferase
MTRDDAIIEMGSWLRTPPGTYLLAWEQERLDHAVNDIFGYHALQLGLPELEALRANRMPHRWVVRDTLVCSEPLPAVAAPPADSLLTTLTPPEPTSLHCDFEALPFPQASIDLVVLPHTLERARDAHEALREVERVLVPEGRVVITGFNPASLWGLRQRLGRMGSTSTSGGLYLPTSGEYLGYWRLRDWLRLLGFEIEIGRFGCWRPPVRSPAWLQRWRWIDPVGERWWPVLGAVYVLVAVKRVRGMHLVGRIRTDAKRVRNAAVARPVAAPRAQRAMERALEDVE